MIGFRAPPAYLLLCRYCFLHGRALFVLGWLTGELCAMIFVGTWSFGAGSSLQFFATAAAATRYVTVWALLPDASGAGGRYCERCYGRRLLGSRGAFQYPFPMK